MTFEDRRRPEKEAASPDHAIVASLPPGKRTLTGELPFRAEMEAAFGADFSAVKVATGQRDAMAALGAEAATVDEEVSFAEATPDRRLVAHELTHVIQNRAAGGGLAFRGALDVFVNVTRAGVIDDDAGSPVLQAPPIVVGERPLPLVGLADEDVGRLGRRDGLPAVVPEEVHAQHERGRADARGVDIDRQHIVVARRGSPVDCKADEPVVEAAAEEVLAPDRAEELRRRQVDVVAVAGVVDDLWASHSP